MIKSVMSFGYSNGIPEDVDMIYDVRCFRNPYRRKSLRASDGRDERIRRYVLESPGVQEFIDEVIRFSAKEERVAIGCFGGRHRSVAIAEEIARRTGAYVSHRDL